MGGMHQSFLSTMHSRPKRHRRRMPHASVGDLLGGVHGSVASQTRSTLCDICSSQAWHNQGRASYSVHLRRTIPRWSLWTPPWVTSGCHPVLYNGRCMSTQGSSCWPISFARNPPINHPRPVLYISMAFCQQTPQHTHCLGTHAREVFSYL